jgi:hypothetical protein
VNTASKYGKDNLKDTLIQTGRLLIQINALAVVCSIIPLLVMCFQIPVVLKCLGKLQTGVEGAGSSCNYVYTFCGTVAIVSTSKLRC